MQMKTTSNRFGRGMLAGILLTVAMVALGGCWNGDISNIHLGDVSLGQQLIDLKQALAEEAISQEEYDAARAKLVEMYAICEASGNE